MLETILTWFLFFLSFLRILIFLDGILSLLSSLFWSNIRLNVFASILDPLYFQVKKYLPTNIWVIDLTPLVLLFIIMFLEGFVFILFPEMIWVIKNYY